jgi:transposase
MTKANYFDHENKPQYKRSFSEDFKKNKIRELEKNLSTVSDICNTYAVSRTSVYKWIYKYSAMAKKQVKQVVEAKSDTQKIRALEDRIKELERGLSEYIMSPDELIQRFFQLSVSVSVLPVKGFAYSS